MSEAPLYTPNAVGEGGASGDRSDNLLVRIHFIIVMIRWTGLAPWEFEFRFPGSLTSTFPGCTPCCTCAPATKLSLEVQGFGCYLRILVYLVIYDSG